MRKIYNAFATIRYCIRNSQTGYDKNPLTVEISGFYLGICLVSHPRLERGTP